MSFFEPDGAGGFDLAMEQRAGVKIFGGCSRIYPQKSLSLHARGRYGAPKFEHRVFPDLDIEQFDDLVLRSSAQDWRRTMFRDAMIQTLTREMDLDGQAYRPAVVYLNGAYWGLHNVREKLNEDYVAAHYGLADEDVEVIDGMWAGQSPYFDGLIRLLDADLNTPGAFEAVERRMDVDQFIDYQIAQIYAANADWPANNVKLWRLRSARSQWRWMIFDTDFGYGGNGEGQVRSNTLALATATDGPPWPNPPWSTYLFRRLLTHDGFRRTFIQRLAAHTATTFDAARTHRVIDSLRAGIAGEIPRHKARWPRSISFGSTWDAQIEIMRDFARRRPQSVRGHVTSYFDDVLGSARLSLGVRGSGHIRAEGLAMPRATEEDPFGAIFYRGVPVHLVAVPDEGYVFTGWSGLAETAADTLALTLTESGPLTATFALATDAESVSVPTVPRLGAVYPNPASRTATVEVTLGSASPLSLRVIDMLGREVAVLLDTASQPAGAHRLAVDTRHLPSGVYSIVMDAEEVRAARRFVVAR